MPKFLEQKLKQEYPGNDSAVYGTLNSLGLMKGNKETPKGRLAQAKHDAAKSFNPAQNLGKYHHKPKGKR
jgi:hypothetical protein